MNEVEKVILLHYGAHRGWLLNDSTLDANDARLIFTYLCFYFVRKASSSVIAEFQGVSADTVSSRLVSCKKKALSNKFFAEKVKVLKNECIKAGL